MNQSPGLQDEDSVENEISELQTQGKKTQAIKHQIFEAKSRPLTFVDYFTSSRIKVKNDKSKVSSAMRLIGSYLRRMFKTESQEKHHLRSRAIPEEDKDQPVIKVEKEDEEEVEFDHLKLKECKELVANEFNVLIYGIGSKCLLLKELAYNYLSEVGDVLYVNGASAAVNMKQILSKVIDIVCKKSPSRPKMVPSRLTDQISWLEERLTKLAKNDATLRIVLVIHCLDVVMGIDPTNRDAISKLAGLNRIQIMASIENSRCFTLWDSISLSLLRFVYINMDTYLPYLNEECYFLDQYTRSEDVKERGLAFILKSLTDRHKEILKILAQYQLDNPKESGLTREKLFELANDKMLVSSQKQLKDCLVEFIDHKVVQEKEESDGKTHISVSFSKDILEKILADKI